MADKHKAPHGEAHHEEEKGNLTLLWEQVKERPFVYAGCVVFVLAAAVLSWGYRFSVDASRAEEVSALTRALSEEDDEARLFELEVLIDESDYVKPEAVYMYGETAYLLNEHEKAKAAFERMRGEFPDFEFTPDAVEGIGFVLEAQGQYSDARETYASVVSTWPDSFASRRQPFNRARAFKNEGDFESAIAAYREQLTAFPGSQIAIEAQRELDRIRQNRPELFESTASAMETPLTTDVEALDMAPLREGPMPLDPLDITTESDTELEDSETP